MNNIYDTLIRYIEENKTKYNIGYEDTICYLEEIVETIKKEYEELGDE